VCGELDVMELVGWVYERSANVEQLATFNKANIWKLKCHTDISSLTFVEIKNFNIQRGLSPKAKVIH
jgi:hypothetical protein